MSEQAYAIGIPGKPWGEAEKAQWLAQQKIQRSYQDEVVSVIETLGEEFDVVEYGHLDYQPQVKRDYALFLINTKNPDPEKPYILVTGGVHGYETSGIHGALRFIKEVAGTYREHFNIVVAPCISPWGYETINRWNVFAQDPNRSFTDPVQTPESSALMNYLEKSGIDFLAHIDLHETTDSDNSEFRPALAAREGTVNHNWNIPDGFYLVANAELPQPEFQRAIIESVEEVTHIAEPDDADKLIGVPVQQRGVIEYAGKKLGLCMGLSNAQFVTTTEVYPDSAKATPEQCIRAQVAAITGALDFLK